MSAVLRGWSNGADVAFRWDYSDHEEGGGVVSFYPWGGGGLGPFPAAFACERYGAGETPEGVADRFGFECERRNLEEEGEA